MKVTPSRLAVSLALITAGFFPQTYGSAISDSSKQYQLASSQGNDQQALSYALAAVEESNFSSSNEPENWLKLNYNLALAYAKTGNYEQATEQFERVIALSEDLHGEYHIQTYAAKLELVRLYEGQLINGTSKRQKLAHQRLVQRLLLNLDEAEKAHPEDAAQLYYLVSTQMLQNYTAPVSTSQAQKIVERSVELAKATWGDNDTRTLEQQFLLGKRLFITRDYNDAIAQLNMVTHALDTHLNYSHPWSLQAHALLSEAYMRKGNVQLANYHNQQISDMTPSQQDLAPIPLLRERPAYPNIDQRMREPASVQIKFDLSDEGQVVNARVLGIDGSHYFAESALNAVKQWRYAPKFENGEAVATSGLTVNVDFAENRNSTIGHFDGYNPDSQSRHLDIAAYRVVDNKSTK